MNSIEQTWLQDNPDLEIYVTEWNQKANTNAFDPDEDYGLKNAAEMLYILDEMLDRGGDVSHVWPLQQNAKSALSYGRDFEELSPTGEMFRMLRENLPGKQQIDLTNPGSNGETSSDIMSFYGDDELVVYVISRSEDVTFEDIGMNNIIEAYDEVEITRLGVEEGEAPGSNQSDAEVEVLSSDEYFQDGVIQADLDGFEIMQLVFSNVELTPEVEALVEGVDPDPGPIFPPTDPVDPGEPGGGGSGNGDDDDDDDEEDDDGFGMGIEAVLAAMLIPLLIFGIAG